MTLSVLLRIDILGFTKFMQSSEADSIMDKIETIVKTYADKVKWMPKEMKTELKVHQMYGDTLDIHYDCTDGDAMLFSLLDIASGIICDFVNDGMLVRGAIVRGDLKDNRYTFTGEVMATAHDEEKGCHFPSVMIDDAVVSTLNEQIQSLYGINSDEKVNEFVFEYNGKYYLDYIKNDKELLLQVKDVVKCYREKAESQEEMKKCSEFEKSLGKYELLFSGNN